ncbi:MAG: family 20 glycosylhydrolase [Sphaerochaeta sp.]|nr:family 20 glycosylhydrolase [Sphaerochaeta sp.]
MLLPKPKSLKPCEGTFILSHNTRILLDSRLDAICFESAKFLKKHINESICLNISIIKTCTCYDSDYIYLEYDNKIIGKEQYVLSVEKKGITIKASHASGLYYGVVTLCQLVTIYSTQIECVLIEDTPYYKDRAYLLDITRGRIPKLTTIKQLIDRLSYYKINQLQLYIEHTFAFKHQSEVWSKTDPITAEEILEIDRYCTLRGIELVPCIATFGHLYDTLSSNSFKHLSEVDIIDKAPFTWYERMKGHILNVSDPRSFEFVKIMLDEFLPLFSSDKINICCDETFDLGKGKSKSPNGENNYIELYMGFVNKIVNYLELKEKKVMIWGDIILNHPTCIPQIPNNITCLNWYYYYNADEKNIKILADNNIQQYVCASVSGFSRMVHEMDMSFTNIQEMIKLGCKYGVNSFLNTDWGDSGHINHLAGSIPGIVYGGALSWNPDDIRSFEEIDQAISLVEYGDYSQTLIPYIRELSHQDSVIFNSFAFFRDYKVYQLEKDFYDTFKQELFDTNEKTLIQAIANSDTIEKEIANLSIHIKETNQQDIKEFYLSARGVNLMQTLALILKKYEFGQNIQLTLTPNILAEQLEYWLYDYCIVWRAVNKEGELFRIKEFIFDICNILRRY